MNEGNDSVLLGGRCEMDVKPNCVLFPCTPKIRLDATSDATTKFRSFHCFFAKAYGLSKPVTRGPLFSGS